MWIIILFGENSKIALFTQATTGGKNKHNSVDSKHRLTHLVYETGCGSPRRATENTTFHMSPPCWEKRQVGVWSDLHLLASVKEEKHSKQTSQARKRWERVEK